MVIKATYIVKSLILNTWLANCSFLFYVKILELPANKFMFILLIEQVSGGWLIDGQKRWIGNSTFADILVVFARNTNTNQING